MHTYGHTRAINYAEKEHMLEKKRPLWTNESEFIGNVRKNIFKMFISHYQLFVRRSAYENMNMSPSSVANIRRGMNERPFPS